MKILWSIIFAASNVSCCVRPQINTCVPIADTEHVTRRVEATQSSLNEAKSVAQKQGQSIHAAKVLNERMDGKIIIILKNLE